MSNDSGLQQLMQQQQQMMQALLALMECDCHDRRPASEPPAPAPRADSSEPSSGVAHQRSTHLRPRKLDIPVLAGPESVDLTAFADWRQRWTDYVAITRAMTEVPEMSARQGLLRSALDSEWSVLWQTGRLGVAQSDDQVGRSAKARTTPSQVPNAEGLVERTSQEPPSSSL